MKSPLLLMLAFSFVGCASSNTALAKRDAIREVREAQNAPVDVATYSSDEGVRGALWGMTPEQVIELKGEPVRRGPNFLMYDDLVDTDLVPTTYAFFDGHLAQVKSHFETSSDRMRIALGQKYGRGESDFDKARLVYDYNKAESIERAVTAAATWDIALTVIGAVALTASAVAVGSRAGHFNSYPLCWGPRFADRELVRKTLESAPMPARETVWRTSGSDLHLVTLDNGVTDLTWSSRALGPLFVRAQISAAGVEDLAHDL